MTNEEIARAENLGSLLQPQRLLEARLQRERGALTAADVSSIEDEEIVRAVALQEAADLDVVTDGEFRRTLWADTVRHLNGFQPRHEPRSYPARVRAIANSTGGDLFGGRGFATVMERISPTDRTVLGEEYAFLSLQAHSRTKYTIAAPSYHRRYWSDEISPSASGYGSCEEFLVDVRDWIRSSVERLVANGCTYVQLDAPNYGSLCDPDTRAFHAEHGHDLVSEIGFDAELDSSVFAGIDVTGALHVCRGNLPGGVWHSEGGYDAIAEQLFPNLDVDVVLLEYDSERSGDFGPITLVPHGTVVVLGLVTTKDADLEELHALKERVREATAIRSLEDLALSTQCGFASAANAPMTEEEQQAKLRLVSRLAHEIWK